MHVPKPVDPGADDHHRELESAGIASRTELGSRGWRGSLRRLAEGHGRSLHAHHSGRVTKEPFSVSVNMGPARYGPAA